MVLKKLINRTINFSTNGFSLSPLMLNWIKVWRLGWPLHNLKTMVFEPGFGLLAGVLGIVVLLEDNVIGGLAPILKAILQCILQDADIEVGVHLALDLHRISSIRKNSPGQLALN